MHYLFKYGYLNFIYVFIIITIGLILKNNYIVIFGFVILGFFFFFFRRPNNELYLREDNIITAPSYGKITNMVDRGDTLLISTFLSVFDPHIQYVPINGFLKKIKYFPGKFNAANFFEKTRFNERCSYYFKTKYGNIVVTQIAGMIARKIVSFIKTNNTYKQGTELGMIKFGSRVDILIEKKNYNFVPTCKIGDYLNGNISSIGYFQSS